MSQIELHVKVFIGYENLDEWILNFLIYKEISDRPIVKTKKI